MWKKQIARYKARAIQHITLYINLVIILYNILSLFRIMKIILWHTR